MVVQLRKYSSNGRCHPSSCLLAVLPMLFTLETSEMSAIVVFTSKTTQPRPQDFSVNGQTWSSVAGYGGLCVCF